MITAIVRGRLVQSYSLILCQFPDEVAGFSELCFRAIVVLVRMEVRDHQRRGAGAADKT